MLEVKYYRVKAKVNDLRFFRNVEEFEEWKEKAEKYERIVIVSMKEAE